MLETLNWAGVVEVNGVKYDTLMDACNFIKNKDITIDSITLYSNTKKANTSKITHSDNNFNLDNTYIITVKKYMTQPSTPSFNFMEKWNNNVPMPLITMVGKVEKETNGMVYMKLHGDIISKQMQTCMKCGRPITNAVSQFFGMGPECGGHNYINPFESDEELKEVVDKYRKEYLQTITWEGWIIRSAVVGKEIYNGPE